MAYSKSTVATLAASALMLLSAVSAVDARAAGTARYAGVGGSTTDPTCTDPAHPCDLVYLLESVAQDGDDVTIEPGTYAVGQAIVILHSLNIHGQEGKPRPVIQIPQGVSDGVDTGTVLRYLHLELDSAFLHFAYGTAEQLIVEGGSNTCELDNPAVFRDNVCATTGNGPAIDVSTNGGTESFAIRNVTALATGTHGHAIKVATQNAGGNVTVNLFNTIARGGTALDAGDLLAATLGVGTATINTNHSNWAKGGPSGPGAAINTSVTDQSTAPLFIPGTFNEAPTSSGTIGKGAPDPSDGAFDFEGDLRAIGGATDIGADEYVSAAPTVTGVAASGTGSDDSTISATINPSGSPTTYSVRFGPTPAYGESTEEVTLPASEAGQPVTAQLSGLTAGSTYHYAVVATSRGGTTTSPDQVFTTSPVSPPLGGGTPTPSLSGLRVSPRTFLLRGHRVGGRCAAAIKRHAGDQPCRRPIKLTVVYTLNTADTVTFTFKRKTRARTAGHRCVKPTVDRRQTDRCTRWIGLPARLTTVGAVGDNSFAFYGKVGGNRLHPGTYRLTATPSGGAPHTVTLKIVT